MTIHEIIPPAPAADPGAAPAPTDWAAALGYACTPSQRYAGWIGERQRTFLQALSEGHSVDHACRVVGLSMIAGLAGAGAGYAVTRSPASYQATATVFEQVVRMRELLAGSCAISASAFASRSLATIPFIAAPSSPPTIALWRRKYSRVTWFRCTGNL